MPPQPVLGHDIGAVFRLLLFGQVGVLLFRVPVDRRDAAVCHRNLHKGPIALIVSRLFRPVGAVFPRFGRAAVLRGGGGGIDAGVAVQIDGRCPAGKLVGKGGLRHTGAQIFRFLLFGHPEP